MIGQSVVSPGGNVVTMNENHHVTKPLLIGEIDDGGQFEIVFRTDPITPDPWSLYLTRNG